MCGRPRRYHGVCWWWYAVLRICRRWAGYTMRRILGLRVLRSRCVCWAHLLRAWHGLTWVPALSHRWRHLRCHRLKWLGADRPEPAHVVWAIDGDVEIAPAETRHEATISFLCLGLGDDPLRQRKIFKIAVTMLESKPNKRSTYTYSNISLSLARMYSSVTSQSINPLECFIG